MRVLCSMTTPNWCLAYSLACTWVVLLSTYIVRLICALDCRMHIIHIVLDIYMYLVVACLDTSCVRLSFLLLTVDSTVG